VRMEVQGFTGNYSYFVNEFRQHILNFVGRYPLTYGDIHILQQCLSAPQSLPNKTDDVLAQALRYLGFYEVAIHREKLGGNGTISSNQFSTHTILQRLISQNYWTFWA
jgi:hypothetical protein